MEENKDLSFSGNDPGAVKHGNFINYYSFHSTDQRISNLSADMFPPVHGETIICLDIGCNTGDLTISLREYLLTIYPKSRIKILAIDIDGHLIERAKEKKYDSIEFATANIMTDTDSKIMRNYLEKNNRTCFDITFCFSVTMWIHLNNGDEGLIKFLEFLKSITRLIIIEPQPWKCYRTAQRRMTKCGKSFELYKSLKIKSDVLNVIESILTTNGYTKLYESPLSLWNRKVESYYLLKTEL